MDLLLVLVVGVTVWLVLLAFVVVLCTAASRADEVKDRVNAAAM